MKHEMFSKRKIYEKCCHIAKNPDLSIKNFFLAKNSIKDSKIMNNVK